VIVSGKVFQASLTFERKREGPSVIKQIAEQSDRLSKDASPNAHKWLKI